MNKLQYDVKRGADTYRKISGSKLRNWILSGMIKPGEVVIWRDGLSRWCKAEEVEELKGCFKKWEETKLERKLAKTRIQTVSPLGRRVKKILIIDDEADLCWLLSHSLKKKGYEILAANTKRQGIRCLEEKPDMVLLDLKLPDGDGMEVLDDIKNISPESIVVIISAYGSEERRGDTIGKDVYDFIDKPFSDEAILKIIKKVSNE